MTGNYTRRLSEHKALSIRFNGGRNDYDSSGQIPLDQVDRFGFIDPTGGGRVRSGTAGLYYRKDGAAGDTLNLYSNFTFFLNDPIIGDAIQQHDSRLQEGANVQYLRPHSFGAIQGLFTGGGNFHGNQINVGLYPRIGREPAGVTSRANARVTNGAGYVQESLTFFHGRLLATGGLRYDVKNRVEAALSGVASAGRWQPKGSLALTPSQRVYANYGRGISTSDARAVVEYPDNTRIATTDFYQLGVSHHAGRFSAGADVFLIDRSNEQVYIPDDGTFEFTAGLMDSRPKPPSGLHGAWRSTPH